MLHIPAYEIAKFLKDWSLEFAPEYSYIFDDMDLLVKILDLGRDEKKPRKDLVYARQIMEFISYFYDQSFKVVDGIPAEAASDVIQILESYLSSYNHADTQEEWFNKIREIATELGYAAKPKDFKKNPDDYKGHVGHVSTVIRLALVGRAQSPDVWAIQQIMGEDMVRGRINRMIEEEK